MFRHHQWVNIILILVLIVGFLFAPTTYCKWLLIACLCVSVYYCIVMVKEYDFTLRPITFFLFAYFIVNWQLYIDLIIGNITEFNHVFINQNLITRGGILSTLGLVAISTTYSKNYKVNNDVMSCSKYSNSIQNKFTFIQILSFLYWISSLSMDDFSGQSYLTSGAYDNTATGYENILFNTSQIISLAYFMKLKVKGYRQFLSRLPKFVLITSVLYALIKLMSGDRGGAIWTLILYFCSIVYSTKVAPKTIFVFSFVIIGGFIMTSLSFSRSMGDKLSFIEKITYLIENKDAFSERYEFETISPPTRELANSLICTHIALDEIYNNNEDYHYGMFHGCYLLNMIPFLGSKIQSAINVNRLDRSSSEYVTVKHNGENYTSGLGTTMIADSFLEFGIISFIIAFLFIGLIFRKADYYYVNVPKQYTPAWIIIMILSLCCYSISMPRGYFMFYVKYYFYAIGMYWLVVKKIK